MTAHVPRLPFSLDPLIAEAKRRARQRRFLLAVVGAVVALAVGGAVFATRSAGSLVAGPPSAGCPANIGAGAGYLASARTRTAAAHRDEVRLLCLVVIPKGARLLTTGPALLKGEGILGVFPKPFARFARHRFWLVRAPMAAVVKFEETHAPAGSLSRCGARAASGDCGVGVRSGPHVPPNAGLDIVFRPIRGRVGSRELSMSFLGLPNGWTAIRVDAINRPWTSA